MMMTAQRPRQRAVRFARMRRRGAQEHEFGQQFWQWLSQQFRQQFELWRWFGEFGIEQLGRRLHGV
jgi:hypothetical protein